MSARFRRCFAMFLLVLSGIIAAPLAFAETTYSFNLPEQALADSLRAIGQQTEMNILFEPEAVKNARSPALRGQYTVDEAIRIVLAGTKLEAQHTAATNVVIKLKSSRSTAAPATSIDAPGNSATRLAQSNSGSPQTQSAPGPQDTDTSNSTSEPSKKEGLSEVVVTGTLIHDVAPITPVTTITHDDIINQGYSTLADVIEQLPQNFKAGASPQSNVNTRQGADAAFNTTYASGVNLRGLGAAATLVLVNGRRLAAAGIGTVTDISSIPVSLIERVEILTDGASALYGSDAVAGVVNIITRKDFSGVEAGARLDEISRGKAPNNAEYVLGGYSWSTGNVVLDVDRQQANPLFASDRSFTANAGLPDPTILLPENSATTYYASLQNAFTDRLSFSGDATVSERRFTAQSADAPGFLPDIAWGRVSQYSASADLTYKIGDDWRVSLIGQYSHERDQTYDENTQYGNGISYLPFTNSDSSIQGRADGKLFHLPGGAVSLALGGEFRRQDYQDASYSVFPPPEQLFSQYEASRHISSAFAELLIPLVGDDNAVPLVHRLRIDVSGRYDNYSDFGHSANPKVAIDWSPVEKLTLHASASRSFQAPSLYQISTEVLQGYVASLTDPRKGPNGVSTTLLLYGNNPDLQPETAKNFNVGFAYEPIAGLKLDATYFHIDFRNRIENAANEGFFYNALIEEAALGSLVQRNPSVAQAQQALSFPGRTIYNGLAGFCVVGTPGCATPDPSSIEAIANLGWINAGIVKIGGVDLGLHYVGQPTRFGRWRGDVEGTDYTTYQEFISPISENAHLLNTVYNPLKFRAKANLGWDMHGLSANVRVNYSNAYQNTSAANLVCPGAPDCTIASWATVDLSLAYSTPKSVSNRWYSDLRVGIDATNLFNREPPLLSRSPASSVLPFDATNSNPFMRMLAVTFSKRFDW